MKYINYVKLQKANPSVDSTPLDVKQKSLEDFFMTDSISRASPTMAKCIQAVQKQQQNCNS